MKKHGAFSTVTTEGGLLPSGLLRDITSSKTDLSGAKPTDYHLGVGERINEAVSRSYSRLANAWKGFQKNLTELPETDLGTTITRERWLLILFQELGYGRLMTSSAIEIEGKSYPISHFWHKSPIHLVGARVNLDRRTAKAAGAARTSPHSLVQEFLNRSEECLWGFVANGLTLRILRDNASMTRQSYVEFDLAAMMEGEVYADFALLWMLCHQSRVEAENIHNCWLEQWAKQAQDQGSRALEKLREGVEEAISCLGSGFIAHPANKELKDSLRSGRLSTQDYYRQLLRLVYRFLFLFVAEDRNLLLAPNTDSATREIYKRFYSISRLRDMAGKRKGTRHADLYEGIKLVMDRLADENGCPQLGLACLGGFLWSHECIHDLVRSHLMNQDLLDSIRALAYFVEGNVLTPVDYKHLGSEELGSIYESLLELHAEANIDSATFDLLTAEGHERKTTGSYYTHPSLVQCLLDSALEPIIAEAIKKSNPEESILSLKICDPACGSGHFLVAASHRLAKRLAMVRTGDVEPAPEDIQTALRDVIGRSIYGVDINPMAVELCKVSLWMEALEPGKPLSFLDHRILCGNSLLGTTPALIRDGIPDAAFKPYVGDDKDFCKTFKKKNKEERKGKKGLFGPTDMVWQIMGDCHVVMTHVDTIEDSEPKGIKEKEKLYKRCVKSEGFQHAKLVADAWCAAFAWEKKERLDLPDPITHDLFKELENNPKVLPEPMAREVHRLAEKYAFFHWHLAFPDVFDIPVKDEKGGNEQTGWTGGFDCILGNPPWVRQELLKPIKQLLTPFYSYTSTADSSVYFLELSSNITRLNGRVALLTPNKWFRANYAKKLRGLLREKNRFNLIVDFGHSRTLFPDADTFPAAIIFEPKKLQSVLDTDISLFVKAHDSDRLKKPLQTLVRDNAVPVYHRNLDTEGWLLESIEISNLMVKILNQGNPFNTSYDAPILSGLKSGFNKAFYINNTKYDQIVNEDENCREIIKKFLRGRDISRWESVWDGQWHIVIPSSYNKKWPWSDVEDANTAEKIFKNTYGPVYDHLKKYKKNLIKRTDKGKYWWELRSCDYYGKFDEPKIIVQCIAYYSRFTIDFDGYYINNKTIFIPSDDLYLLGILNSRIIWWLVNRVFQHMKDDGLSVDVHYLKKLPIPNADQKLKNEIASIVKRILSIKKNEDYQNTMFELENKLNLLSIEAFHLTEKDCQIIEHSLPPRDPLCTIESSKVIAPHVQIVKNEKVTDDLFKPLEESLQQIFPWKGREQFIRDLIPHLVMDIPGLSFETYRTAAVLASQPEKLRNLLSEEAAAQMDALPKETLKACTFPDSHHFRPRDLRISLEERKQWITIDPQSGATSVPQDKNIPALSINIDPLVPFVIIAVEELHKMKQDATKRAKALLDDINAFESTLAA